MGRIESIRFVKSEQDGEIKLVTSGFCDGCFDEFEPGTVKSFKWLDGEFLCPKCYSLRTEICGAAIKE